VATEKLEFLWPEERIKESKSIGVWSCRHPYVATQHDWSSEAGGFGRRAGLGAMMEQTARVPTETSDPWSPMQISAEALWRRGPYSYVQRLASTRTTGRRTASFDNSLIG